MSLLFLQKGNNKKSKYILKSAIMALFVFNFNGVAQVNGINYGSSYFKLEDNQLVIYERPNSMRK